MGSMLISDSKCGHDLLLAKFVILMLKNEKLLAAVPVFASKEGLENLGIAESLTPVCLNIFYINTLAFTT